MVETALHYSALKEEQSARKILSVFAENGLRAGESLIPAKVNEGFLNDPQFEASDYESGVKHAIQRGWIVFNGNTACILTGAGFLEISKA